LALKLTLFAFLAVAVASDFRDMHISNRLIIFGIILGIVLRLTGERGTDIFYIFFNISFPVILLYLLFQIRALGAADIKLFSMTGAYLTTRQLLYIMAAAFVGAALLGGGKLLYGRWKGKKGETLIHFSLPILLGYIVVVWGWKIE
jgi:prepilin peptidase CpaA